MMSADRLIEAYKTVLADLEQRRMAIDQQIEAVKAALAGVTGETLPTFAIAPIVNGSEPPKIETDTFLGMSVNKAARTYLKMVGKKQHIREIVAAINRGRGGVKTTEEIASTMLRRREDKAEDVVGLGRGEWGLVEWYPDLKRKRAKQRQTISMDAEEVADGSEPKLGEAPPTSSEPDEDVPF